MTSILPFSAIQKLSTPAIKFSGEKTLDSMPHEIYDIDNVKVTIAHGDMTKIPCDAYIMPEFDSGPSFGGVGAAIARAGGSFGINEYGAYVKQNGTRPFGEVLLTPSGGGNSKQLLHVVSVGSAREDEYNTIETCIYNALKVAEENGLKSIVAPALGTGIIGQLTGEQSAKAMLSAVNRFAKEGGQMDISFVIYGNKPAYQDFSDVLRYKRYEFSAKEPGKAEFNIARWITGMKIHTDAARKFQKDND